MTIIDLASALFLISISLSSMIGCVFILIAQSYVVKNFPEKIRYTSILDFSFMEIYLKEKKIKYMILKYTTCGLAILALGSSIFFIFS